MISVLPPARQLDFHTASPREAVRVFEELDELHDLLFGLVAAGNVGVGHVDVFFPDLLGFGLPDSEDVGHAAAAAARAAAHGAHDVEPGACASEGSTSELDRFCSKFQEPKALGSPSTRVEE